MTARLLPLPIDEEAFYIFGRVGAIEHVTPFQIGPMDVCERLRRAGACKFQPQAEVGRLRVARAVAMERRRRSGARPASDGERRRRRILYLSTRTPGAIAPPFLPA